jgi:hypothetical protein
MAVSIVNNWNTSTASSYTYGSVQVPVANTAGNWLFAMAQWEQTEDNAVVYCADDAHNFWQPVIANTSTTAAVRTAVVLVQNALAATKVYFSSTGFIRNAIYNVIEVSGLQAQYVLDVTTSVTAASGTSITLSTTLTQADFVLASAVQDTTSSTISVTGGTALGNVQNTTLQANMGWNTAGAGAFSMTFTNAGAVSAAWAGVLIAVRSAAPLVLNANPNWPVISCQAAFGSSPSDPAVYPAWTDITTRYRGLDAQRGRQYELDQLAAATVTIELDNFDGAFNPVNTASPYYPNVKLMTPVRVLASWQGRTYQVFSGHIEYLPETYDATWRGVVQAECSDAFGKLPQVLLFSAMQEEVKYDSPFFYFPLDEPAGAGFATNRAGRNTAAEMHPANIHGGATSNAFGATVSPTFKGAQSTCWTVTGVFNSISVTSLRHTNPADQFPDISSGITIETWCQCSEAASGGSVVFLALEGRSPTTNGVIMYVGTAAATGLATLFWYDTAGSLHSVLLSNTVGTDGGWHHYAIQMTGTTYNAFLDGVSVASGSMTPIRTDPHIFEVGGLTSPYGPLSIASSSPLNFAHVAYYDKILDAERIAEHSASGFGGFVNDFTGQRISRILRYARWGKAQGVDGGINQVQRLDYLAVGGYASSSVRGTAGLFGTFGASSVSGSQADLVIVDTAATENGLLLVDRNGALMFRQHNNLYNPALAATFGDTFVPLNPDPYFTSFPGPWTAGNGGTAASGKAIWTYAGVGSAVLTGNGSTANPNLTETASAVVSGSTAYTLNAWVYSPQGWGAVQPSISWYTSAGVFISTSAGTAVNVPPATPVPLTFTATSPSNARLAAPLIQMNGTPAGSVQLVADRVTVSASGLQVTYGDDIGIDYDIVQLFNEVIITRNVDQIVIRAVDTASQKQYFPRSYQRTIYSQGGDPPTEAINVAQWLLLAYAQPAFRIAKLTVDAASNPDMWPFALGLDVGDTVTVTRQAFGAPALTANYQIIGVTPEFAADKAAVSYSMAPVLVPVLTLDNAVFGLLGPNTLGW